MNIRTSDTSNHWTFPLMILPNISSGRPLFNSCVMYASASENTFFTERFNIQFRQDRSQTNGFFDWLVLNANFSSISAISLTKNIDMDINMAIWYTSNHRRNTKSWKLSKMCWYGKIYYYNIPWFQNKPEIE